MKRGFSLFEWVQSGWIKTQRTRYYLMAINEILNDYNYKSCKRKEHVKIQVNKVKLNQVKANQVNVTLQMKSTLVACPKVKVSLFTTVSFL